MLLDVDRKILKNVSHNWKGSDLYLPTWIKVMPFLVDYKYQLLHKPPHGHVEIKLSADQKKSIRLGRWSN